MPTLSSTAEASLPIRIVFKNIPIFHLPFVLQSWLKQWEILCSSNINNNGVTFNNQSLSETGGVGGWIPRANSQNDLYMWLRLPHFFSETDTA